jgi:hypothetical protein
MAEAMANAAPKLINTCAFSPDSANAKPPLRPKAINKYKDKNLEMAGGISRLDRTRPAKTPKTKNKMAGSMKLCIQTFRGSIEDVAQPRFLMPVFVAVVLVIVVIFLITLLSWRRLRYDWTGNGRTFEQFVQLATVEPNTSASGAIIDFNTLPIGHHQGLVIALGTFHDV